MVSTPNVSSFSSGFFAASAFFTTSSCWKPSASVSYTHLDVYKRQAPVRTRQAGKWVAVDTDLVAGENGCLLYTSRCV
ncbi:hypothetical protein [Streptomyces fragilis]|uniref:hypothetical protein n=1 Tax=Streptomyces fragilis TaxID=67301 RepID=UPI0024DEE70C|nr:hypothetical protein [Streptomyces fragilis]